MGKRRGKAVLLSLMLVFGAAALIPQGVLKAEAAPKISKTSMVVVQGQKKKLQVKGTRYKVTWKSSNPSVATVTSKGTVKGVRRGSARITAKAGKNTFRCKVRVAEKPIVVAGTVSTGDTRTYASGLVMGVVGTRNAVVKNEAALYTSGKKKVTLRMVNEVAVQKYGIIKFRNSRTIPPSNPQNGTHTVATYWARSDKKPYVLTKSSKMLVYFKYDGVNYRVAVNGKNLGSPRKVTILN